jgi:hypothetical protein
MVGPVAIDQGRDRYNNIIQSTSKEQTFSNILRVYHHEPTSFMDVTEVDATTTFSGTVNGGIAGIGARAGTSGGTLAGQVESVAGGATYSESPLVRYQPLLGQALVAQLATPVSTDALAALYNSDWGAAPLLDFATTYLTLDYDDLYAALNTIAALDRDEVVELVSEKSDLTKAKDSSGTGRSTDGTTGSLKLEVSNKSGGESNNGDALVIYYLPHKMRGRYSATGDEDRDDYLWSRLRALYSGTQMSQKCPPKERKIAVAADKTKGCRPSPTHLIELRTMPVTQMPEMSDGLTSGAPLLKTFSAVGILKSAAEQPHPRIGFVTPSDYQRIRFYQWNDPQRQYKGLNFYTLLPEDQNDGDETPEEQRAPINMKVRDWLWQSSNPPYVYLPPRVTDYDYIYGNRELGWLRRYILIIHSTNIPDNAYVAHFDHGQWYYIDGNDDVSQKNFDLISLFMTMMATAPTSSLTPAITVGGM